MGLLRRVLDAERPPLHCPKGGGTCKSPNYMSRDTTSYHLYSREKQSMFQSILSFSVISCFSRFYGTVSTLKSQTEYK